MKSLLPPLLTKTLSLSLGLTLSASVGWPVASWALEFPPTSNRGAPSRTAGGGVRGNGCQETAALTKETPQALVPTNNVSTTAIANPTILVYVPREFTQKTARFAILDEDNNPLYAKQLTLPDRSGIVPFSIPASAQGQKSLLEVGKRYTWRFSVFCDPDDGSQDVVVSGWLERTAPSSDLTKALQTAKTDPLKQANLYAQAGLWSETVSLALQLRTQSPQTWEQLLKSVGLEPLSHANLLDPVQ